MIEENKPTLSAENTQNQEETTQPTKKIAPKLPVKRTTVRRTAVKKEVAAENKSTPSIADATTTEVHPEAENNQNQEKATISKANSVKKPINNSVSESNPTKEVVIEKQELPSEVIIGETFVEVFHSVNKAKKEKNTKNKSKKNKMSKKDAKNEKDKKAKKKAKLKAKKKAKKKKALQKTKMKKAQQKAKDKKKKSKAKKKK